MGGEAKATATATGRKIENRRIECLTPGSPKNVTRSRPTYNFESVVLIKNDLREHSAWLRIYETAHFRGSLPGTGRSLGTEMRKL